MTYCTCGHTIRQHAGIRTNEFLTTSGYWSYTLKRIRCEVAACNCHEFRQGWRPRGALLSQLEHGIAIFQPYRLDRHHRRILLTPEGAEA